MSLFHHSVQIKFPPKTRLVIFMTSISANLDLANNCQQSAGGSVGTDGS